MMSGSTGETIYMKLSPVDCGCLCLEIASNLGIVVVCYCKYCLGYILSAFRRLEPLGALGVCV